MERNLAIIGASYLQLPLIKKAKEMGFTTHVFAWKANDVGEKEADVFYPISIIEKDAILNVCKNIGVCGVCSIASDLAAVTVNYVANSLGLPCNSPDAAKKSTNKHLMRLAFQEAGDPSPQSIEVDAYTDLSKYDFTYPVIVKPTDRSGSRGICKLEGPAQLKKSVDDAVDVSFEKKALIEEFVEGQEYSVECISYKGKHHLLAVTLKYTTGAPYFIETGHLEPAPISKEMVQKVQEVVFHALDTLEIQNSASHSEIKIDESGSIKIIEIGGRMGGDCIGSHLVYYSTGVDFLRAVIQVAVGQEPDLKPVREPCKVKCVYIFTDEDLKIMYQLKQSNPELLLEEVYLQEENLNKATDSSSRSGCYIMIAE